MTQTNEPKTRLTPREKEIYKLIVDDNSTTAIAEKLSVSYETIKSHRRNIYRKLRVKSLIELMNLHHKIKKVH